MFWTKLLQINYTIKYVNVLPSCRDKLNLSSRCCCPNPIRCVTTQSSVDLQITIYKSKNRLKTTTTTTTATTTTTINISFINNSTTLKMDKRILFMAFVFTMVFHFNWKFIVLKENKLLKMFFQTLFFQTHYLHILSWPSII